MKAVKTLMACSLVFLSLFRAGAAQEPGGGERSEYVRAIAGALAELDKGDTAAAQQLLEATDDSLRGFEHAYLLARATGASAEGTPADLVRTIPMPEGVEVRYGVLNETNRQMAFISRDGKVRVFDLKAPEAAPTTVAHEGGAIWAGVFSRDGQTFVTGHENGDVVVWDAQSWKPRRTLSIAKKPVRELAVAPDGSRMIVEGETELELWNLSGDEAEKIAAVGERYNFGEGLAFSPQGDRLATGGMFDVVFYDAASGKQLSSVTHASYTMGLEFSPDGARIASAPRGNINKFLSSFDVASGEEVFRAGPFQEYVAGLAFTPDGQRIVATGPQKTVRLFDANTGETVLSLARPDHTAKPSVSRDGLLIGWSEPAGYQYIDLAPGDGDRR